MNTIRTSINDLPNPARRVSELESEVLRLTARLVEVRNNHAELFDEGIKLRSDNAELRERAERAEGERGALLKMSGARESLAVWSDLQEQCREVSKANQVIGDLQAELTATIKAKQENDERFMLERDAARSDLADLRERYDSAIDALRQNISERLDDWEDCGVCGELDEMCPGHTALAFLNVVRGVNVPEMVIFMREDLLRALDNSFPEMVAQGTFEIDDETAAALAPAPSAAAGEIETK